MPWLVFFELMLSHIYGFCVCVCVFWFYFYLFIFNLVFFSFFMHVLERLPSCDVATKRDHFYQVLSLLLFKNSFFSLLSFKNSFYSLHVDMKEGL